MAAVHTKSFEHPDETDTHPNATIDTVNVAELTVYRYTFQPGWRWSQSIKPVTGTEYCQRRHFGFQASGVLHIQMQNGEEKEIGPGEIFDIEPGHDAWVVGDTPVVVYDFGPSLATTEARAKAA